MDYETAADGVQSGGIKFATSDARLLAVDPGEETDGIVLVFEAEDENATVRSLIRIDRYV